MGEQTREKQRYSFRQDRALRQYRDHHPALRALYWHARLSRVVSDKLFEGEFVGTDGRVHTRISLLGAHTGRPSFSAPNLASVPRMFRPVFVVDTPDDVIIEIDYETQEPGIAGAHFGDEALLAAWNGPDDFYIRMGKDLSLNTDSVPRQKLKVITLAMIYGQQAASLGKQLRMETWEADRMLQRVFSRYPTLAKGMKEGEAIANLCGYAETRTGLKRYLPRHHPRHQRNRRARNLPIQGGASGVLKILLPRVHLLLQQMGGRILVPLFDSIIFQVPKRFQRDAIVLVGQEMKTAITLLYPELRPKLDINDADPSCWNKKGRGDSIDRFEQDWTYEL